MLIKQAKNVARQWVLEEALTIPGFYGAFSHGSTNWLADETTLPPTSDVDIMVILAKPNPPIKLGKFIYGGVLLEVSYLPREQVQSPDHILGDYQLAGSFQTANILADPTGQLTKLQGAVAKEYAKRHWVHTRCEHARNKVLHNLQLVNESELFHEQVTAWLFAVGVTTHVLLVAGLKNPTVRQRYVAVRELLADHGLLDFYEIILGLLGCAHMRQEQVEHHLATLADAFDAAKATIRTPFFFATDISDIARPIVVDGSRELIERGFHREAIFWMAATYCRCQKVLYHDAPVVLQEQFRPGYRHLLSELGITSSTDLQHRSAQVKEFLPRLWEVAEVILAANPAVEGRI